jgi:uncharacterized protein YbaA (DUF1428 family)
MYVSGFLSPVPTANKEKYAEHARKAWALFRVHGAVEMMEAWGENVPEGEVTDFRRAVKLEKGESVVFSWIVWPDRETADKCEESMQTDDRWKEMMEMPFDGKRMIYGDFTPLVHEKA